MGIILRNLRAGVITAALALSTCGGLAFAKETTPAKDPTLGEQTSEFVRDYLSDPRRSGSLAGTILGGALTAHPAGTIVGGLVGFFVGKQSMFNEDKVRAQKSKVLYARRDIVPQAGQGPVVPTLSFANAQGIRFDAPPSAEVVAGISPQLPVPVGYSREQVAAMCGGGERIDPRLRSLCFYFQGG